MGCLSLQFVSAQFTSETYRFDKDSLSKEMLVSVPKDCAVMTIEVQGNLKSGSINVEIFNTEGVLKENLKLDAAEKLSKDVKTTKTISSKSVISRQSSASLNGLPPTPGIYAEEGDKVLGQINKTVYHPEEGLWLIKISPEQANALIKIQSSLK